MGRKPQVKKAVPPPVECNEENGREKVKEAQQWIRESLIMAVILL